METKYSAYKPSKAENKLIRDVEEAFQKAKRQRTRGYRHLDDSKLDQFWKDSRDQYNGYVAQEKKTTKKWHSRVFRKKTRKKIVADRKSVV